MKYSSRFTRDFNWYLSVRHTFNFAGKPSPEIIYDKKGLNGKEAFKSWDSEGKKIATRHPNMLQALLTTKASVNLHIKMYAEDRMKGLLPKPEFNEMVKSWKSPDWFTQAVEEQKFNYPCQF